MMASNHDFLAIVYAAIDEINSGVPDNEHVRKSPDTELLGRNAAVDSLRLVRLIVVVEEQLRAKLGVALTLVDEQSMSARVSPFRTVESLADYLREQVAKN
jgi:acyl carrier protein